MRVDPCSTAGRTYDQARDLIYRNRTKAIRAFENARDERFIIQKEIWQWDDLLSIVDKAERAGIAP